MVKNDDGAREENEIAGLFHQSSIDIKKEENSRHLTKRNAGYLFSQMTKAKYLFVIVTFGSTSGNDLFVKFLPFFKILYSLIKVPHSSR